MTTFIEQKQFAEELRLREGETRRINCPFCGGTNTYTANRLSGKLVWNCYKASCPSKGMIDTEMSAETIRERMAAREALKDSSRSVPIPTHLSNVRHHPAALDYLQSVNSMYAFEQGFIPVKFSPAENRVLFFSEDGLGCVGRALDRRRPKWKVYGNIDGIIKVGQGTIGVVVEDVASACAISMLPKCSGCALLGTHATTLAKRQLRGFDQVIIALDKDASQKSLRLKSQIEGRVPTRVILLEQDLKYVSKQEMERLI